MNYNGDQVTKKISKTYDLKKGNPEDTTFTGDIAGQVVYTEKGNDIVVYGYGTKEVKYQKVVTSIGMPGANGKCAKTVSVYEAIYENGEVTGFKGQAASEKTTYIKTNEAGSILQQYQILDSKNKVIATTSESVVGQNKIIVDEKNALVTLTYKNGLGNEKLIKLHTDNNAKTNDLINEVFDAVKSGNNYKGSWLKESASSTGNNETFALGTNNDTITYNFDDYANHGKDTVTLVKDANLTINYEEADGVTNSYAKSGNDIILSMNKDADFQGEDYTKYVKTINKIANGYHVVDQSYVWQNSAYVLDGAAVEYDMSDTEFAQLQKSMKENEGVNVFEGTNTYFIKDDGHGGSIWYEANASIGTVTFKNYFGLEENSVTIGNQYLKTVLQNTNGVGILNYKNAQKKQTVKGTFLNESITGSDFADAISTGKGNDTIILSAGKDTVTIDGTGTKTFKFADIQNKNFGGETTVKFAKNVNSVLELSSTAGTEGMGYVKSGNDLIVDFGAETVVENRVNDEENEVNTSKIIVKDYFKNDTISGATYLANQKTLEQLQADDDEGDYDLMQIGAENKANKFSDTQYSDYMLGGKKADKFTISHGDAMVVLDQGNDTVTVSKDADGGLYVYQLKGSGNDVIDINTGETGTKIDSLIIDGQYSNTNEDFSFEKTDFDLTIKATYNNGGENEITDSLTIKNYFDPFNYNNTQGNLSNNTTFVYGYNEQQQSLVQGTFAEVLAETGKTIKVNGVKYGRGIEYNGSEFNDEYEISINKKTGLYIIDTEGHDKITITSDVNNLRVLFDVWYNENAQQWQYDDEQIIYLFDKNVFNAGNVKKSNNIVSGGACITSHNYLGNSYGEYTYFDKNGDGINVNAWINSIVERVGEWLQESGEYEYAYEVIENGNKQDIASLLQCYDVACPQQA